MAKDEGELSREYFFKGPRYLSLILVLIYSGGKDPFNNVRRPWNHSLGKCACVRAHSVHVQNLAHNLSFLGPLGFMSNF